MRQRDRYSDHKSEPPIQTSSHDGYLFDNGPPDGVTGLSNVEGVLPSGYELNRVVAADFQLEGDALITRLQMSGVWFEGTGADTPIDGLRVRIWAGDADGLPGELEIDFTVGTGAGETIIHAAETGNEFNGRPEVQYTVEINPGLIRPWMPNLWLSIQPIGTSDNFFQLTSATGKDNIVNGLQAYVQWVDLGFPDWTPSVEAADEFYDVTFAIFGFPNEVGACCLDADATCALITAFECAAAGGHFLGSDGDCTFCDPGIDPYTCDGYCGEMAPGGCWCDEWCWEFDDCCDDACDECEDVEFCDPNIDPYDCLGELNGDGVVDGGDLLILLSKWGECADPDGCPADLNEDGVVDAGDLLIQLSNWGSCPEVPTVACCDWCDNICYDIPFAECPVFDICHVVYHDMTCEEVDVQNNCNPPIRCFLGNAVHGVFQGVMTCDECEALFNGQSTHSHWWGTRNGVEICGGSN